MTDTEKIFSIITKQDEITWQSMLYDLVKTEGMDPWDIDIGKITNRYIDMVRTLKEHDFRISGKVLLAAAILLKLKSNRLVGEDILELDRLIAGSDDEDDILFEDSSLLPENERREIERAEIIPRTPQPRKRKVSIYDLVNALEKALEVKHRRVVRGAPEVGIQAPKRTKDITQIIKEVYGKIRAFFSASKGKKLMFSSLLPSKEREDIVHTIIPLLHLAQQRKIDLEQEVPFGDIEVMLASMKKVDKEAAEEVS